MNMFPTERQPNQRDRYDLIRETYDTVPAQFCGIDPKIYGLRFGYVFAVCLDDGLPYLGVLVQMAKHEPEPIYREVNGQILAECETHDEFMNCLRARPEYFSQELVEAFQKGRDEMDVGRIVLDCFYRDLLKER